MERINMIFIVIIVVFIFGGCVAKQPGITKAPETKPLIADLHSCVDLLCEQVMDAIRNTPYETGKVIVISGSLKKRKRFTKLEYQLLESLKRELAYKNIQVIDYPNRNDWIRIKENDPPLSLSGNFAVLELNLDPLVELNEITIYIEAYTFLDGKKEPLPRISCYIKMDFSPDSVARILYNTKAPSIPLPPGTEENPYESFEQLAYSLINETFEKYALPQERAVVDISCACVHPEDCNSLRGKIEDHLSRKEVTITVSRQDFRKITEYIKFIHEHEIFRIERPHSFLPATIHVLIKAQPAEKNKGILRTSVIAFWLEGGTSLHGIIGIAYVKYAIEGSGRNVDEATQNVMAKTWNYIRYFIGDIENEQVKSIIDRKIGNAINVNIDVSDVTVAVPKPVIYRQVILPLTCCVIIDCEEAKINPSTNVDPVSLKQVTYMAIENQLSKYGHRVICAMDWLRGLQDTSDTQPIISALRDRDWHVRWKVAEALSQMEDVRVARPLCVFVKVTPQIDWLHIPHGYIRIRATVELNTIGEGIAPVREQAEIRCLPRVMREGMKRAIIKAASRGAYKMVVKILERGLE
ncbi:MAG: hypothetical protein DRP81_03275 [Candidatus Omnitrophota bacterium]|nr:MAG: hypothetical protein DRP81_03275 [Candidatus Omnitrophota bacterium]